MIVITGIRDIHIESIQEDGGPSLYGLYQNLEKTVEGSIEFDLLLVFFLQLMLTV